PVRQPEMHRSALGRSSAQVEAAERMSARERSGAFPVDVQVADVEPPSRLLDAVPISCEDRTGQAELRVVRDVERVAEVARADDREHRPEDLLLRNARAWADVVEDR